MNNFHKFLTKNYFIILLLLLFYLVIINIYQIDIFGHWETLSVYQILEPGADLILPVIQEMGNTVGNYGINYPLISSSKIISLFFGLDFFSIKYLFIIYSLIFISFFYLVIQKILGTKVSIISSIFIIINPYFVYLSTFLTAQQISLSLIFLNIFLFMNIGKSRIIFWFLCVSISLILMNYIYGRYILLIIIVYFYLEELFKKKISKNILLNISLDYFKIIFISFMLLIILFPPNISLLLSKELFLPRLAFGEEIILGSNKTLLELLILNFNFLTKNFFLNLNNLYNFNLINGESANILNIYLLPFFFVGILHHLKNNFFSLLNIMFFYILLLLCLSHAHITLNGEVSSTLSIYRIYMIFPLFVIYAALGIVFLVDLVFKNKKKNICFTLIIFLLYIFLQIEDLNKSKSKYVQIIDQYKNKLIGVKNYDTENISFLTHRDNLDFNLKLKVLSKKIDLYIKNNNLIDSNDVSFIYLKNNLDLQFKKYPPQLKMHENGKYVFHIFITLYLNAKKDINYSFLYDINDKTSFKKELKKYSTNKYILPEDSNFKFFSKKIAKFLSNFTNITEINDKKNSYEFFEINYFKDPEVIIIFNDKEFNFVKYKLKKDIKTILLTNLIE